jgi:integrase
MAEALGRDAATVDHAAQALARFEWHTGSAPFTAFEKGQAISFKAALLAETNQRTGAPLARSTVLAILHPIREFFTWLPDVPGFRSKVDKAAATYFTPSKKDLMRSRSRRERTVPSVEQMASVLEAMPAATPIQRRGRAVVALAIATAARADAIATLRLKHVDLARNCIIQNGDEVRTKFGKTIVSYLIEIVPSARVIVHDWCRELVRDHGWGQEDPLFPALTNRYGDDGLFLHDGFERRCWATSQPIRTIFARACKAAGQPYFNPHTMRAMQVRWLHSLDPTEEELKALSQNLGHEDVAVTRIHYGRLDSERQARLVAELGAERADRDDLEDNLSQLFERAIASYRRKRRR